MNTHRPHLDRLLRSRLLGTPASGGKTPLRSPKRRPTRLVPAKSHNCCQQLFLCVYVSVKRAVNVRGDNNLWPKSPKIARRGRTCFQPSWLHHFWSVLSFAWSPGPFLLSKTCLTAAVSVCPIVSCGCERAVNVSGYFWLKKKTKLLLPFT